MPAGRPAAQAASEAMRDQAGRGGLGTVRNAIRLLDLLAEGPAFQQLTDLAERSGMSLPTVHRLLRSLVVADLVVQDTRSSRYALGPELTRLSHHYLSRLPLLGAVAPYVTQLRDDLGQSISVQTLVRGEVVTVDRIDGPDSGLYRETHRVVPALSCAAGRLLAARADDDHWALALAAAGSAAIGQDLAARRAEWAGAERLALGPAHAGGPGEVAVPVIDGHGVAVAALAAAVADPADERAVADSAAHLDRAARAAGRTLGHG
ncbi:MAG: helix-turn-helix domain-containing protein [Tetrasphaera sp.]